MKGITIIILILFTVALLLGMYLLSFVVRNKETPKSIAFLHGIVAAIALVMLIIYSVNTNEKVMASTILFVFAAIGGIFFFIKDITGKHLPKWLAIAHGITAEAAFVILLFYVFT